MVQVFLINTLLTFYRYLFYFLILGIGGLSTTYLMNITLNTTQLNALAQCLGGLAMPSNGLRPPQGPPAPPSRPVNAFANIDSRIAFLVSLLMPTLSSSAVAAIASNRTVKA